MSTTNGRNADLLRKIAATIREEPRRHVQRDWGSVYEPAQVARSESLPPCGTTACIAGWAAILTHGADACFIHDDAFNTDSIAARWLPDGTKVDLSTFVGNWSEIITLAEHAGDLLGLSENERFELFGGSWSPFDGDVPAALEALADGANLDEITYGPGEDDWA